MKHFAILTAVAPLALLAACNKPAGDTATDNTMSTMPADENMSGSMDNSMGMDNGMGTDNSMSSAAMTGQQFASAEAASGMFEVESSKLAETKATNSSIKAFAKEMIADHTKANQELMAAAGKATPAITPDKTMNAEQQANMDALRKASGADFDRLYVQQQQAGHAKAVEMTQNYADNGTVEPLKAWAQKTLPTLKNHKNKADALKM